MLEERNILLSIKPIYSERIFTGKKMVEFRKKIPNHKIHLVYVYETSPTRRIAGQFTVKDIISSSPPDLLGKYGNFIGMKWDDYFMYSSNKSVIYAIEITDVVPYNPPIDPFKINPNFKPPQNYCYVSKEFELKINEIRNEVH